MPTLREIRESKQMSREELAYKAHVSVQTIFRLETSKNIPHRNTLAAIARTLKCKPEDIEFPVIEPPKNNGNFFKRLLK
jgi:transcriptional regulator with XRE-family HTH domain